MLSVILIAFVLVAVTVAVHAAGLALLLRAFTTRWQSLPLTRFWPITRLLIHMTWWLILIHLSEIAVWGFSISGGDACPMLKRRSTLPELLTRPLATAIWCWQNRGGCSDRSRG